MKLNQGTNPEKGSNLSWVSFLVTHDRSRRIGQVVHPELDSGQKVTKKNEEDSRLSAKSNQN